MSRDKVLVFDLGGVLIENTGRDGLLALLPYTLDTPEMWRRWLASPSVRLFEAGRMSPAAFAEDFIDEWRLNIEPDTFMAAFASWPKGFFPGARELLASLRTQHRLACLSNTNAVHWGRFPDFPAIFDTCFASHEMGVVKPDREAYAHVLDKLEVRASAVYFFDDLPENVAAAQTLGINAFHVTGFADIEPILRAERLHGPG